MTSNTTNHSFPYPDTGQTDWDTPIQNAWQDADTAVPIVDTQGNRSNYTAKDGAVFRASDTGRVYIGDGSNWVHEESTGPSPTFNGNVNMSGNSVTNAASYQTANFEIRENSSTDSLDFNYTG